MPFDRFRLGAVTEHQPQNQAGPPGFVPMLLFSQSGLVSGQVFTCGGRAGHRFSKIIPNTVCLCCCIPLLCCRQEANNRKVLLLNSQCVLGDGSGRHAKGWSRSSRVFLCSHIFCLFDTDSNTSWTVCASAGCLGVEFGLDPPLCFH